MIKDNSIIPILEFQNISFSYNKNGPLVLDQLDFKIEKNKFVAIAGPNGAGKTTLIKHFNGLLKPNFGDIYHDGEIIKSSKHLTEHIGIVFQNPDEQVFFPKVRDDIVFGLRNRGINSEDIKTKTEEIINQLKISNLIDRSFFSLSFGEKKKVAFAGILITQPDVLVLDEPTIGLDPWAKNHFLDLIESFKSPSRAIICATHDFDLIKRADEIYLLWDGKLSHPLKNFEEFSEEMKKIKL
jgi:cobalt/nickel transport system ATP-binding protein